MTRRRELFAHSTASHRSRRRRTDMSLAPATSALTSIPSLLPSDRPGSWLDNGYEPLLALSWRDCEGVQLQILKRRFEEMKGSVAALERLAKRQGVETVNSVDNLLPLLFDHPVYKSYPRSLTETRD